jgi:predicted helicase
VRANPKLSGTRHNVFGIQTGVAISFFVKRAKHQGCRIFYARRPEFEVAEDKLAFLNTAEIGALVFEEVRPDAKSNWLNHSPNDFNSLLPIASKLTKDSEKQSQQRAIFHLYSLGVSTNRDEWLYGRCPSEVEERARFFIDRYAMHSPLAKTFDTTIKWSESLKRRAASGMREPFDASQVRRAAYRPFIVAYLY